MTTTVTYMLGALSFAALAQLGSGFGFEFNSEIISDITSSGSDESRALEIKVEKFWRPLLKAVEEAKTEEHMKLYAEVDAAIAKLPAENKYVREALAEVVQLLRRSDDKVLAQAVEAASVAADHISLGLPREQGWSFFAKEGYFNSAIRRFVDGGQYSQRLLNHIKNRQESVTPSLRGAADIAGNVLSDCRKASTRSFDVLKFDIYNEGVPMTPQIVNDLANRLVSAAGETRRQFTSQVTRLAVGIASDVDGQTEAASGTVTRSLWDSFQAAETEKPVAHKPARVAASPSSPPALASPGTQICVSL